MNPHRQELPAAPTPQHSPATERDEPAPEGNHSAGETTRTGPPGNDTAGLWLLKQPELPSGIAQVFAPAPDGLGGEKIAYTPSVYLHAEVRFSDRKSGITLSRQLHRVLDRQEALRRDPPFGKPLPEEECRSYQGEPREAARFAAVPEKLRERTLYSGLERAWEDYLYHHETLDLLYCPLVEEYSRPGESEAEFRLRLSVETREKRDAAVQELRGDFRKKLDASEEKILQAAQRLEKEKAQRGSAAVDSLMRMGTAVLGAFMGRKKLGITSMRRGSSAARGAGRAWKEHQDVEIAREKLEEMEKAATALEQELHAALEKLKENYQPANLPVEPYRVTPYKKDITTRKAGLLWRPQVLD
jgi:hypothetical protein